MKKMKGVAAVEYPPKYAVHEDPRIRFKHQRLIEDYDELQKLTQAKQQKLERMKQKRLVLLAEVRFLRQRYKYLMKNQSTNTQPERHYLQPQDVESQGKNTAKERLHVGKGTILRQRGSVNDLKRKKKVPHGKEIAIPSPVPVLNSNVKERSHSGKEASVRISASMFDLNQKERLNEGKETPVHRNVTPAFDLNQISVEEEELQGNYELLSTQEPKNDINKGGWDEQLKDKKLLSCRNIGDGPNRTGKRKISWQDQVALRV